MKSKGAIINDLWVNNFANGNQWIKSEQTAVLAILNEAKLGNIMNEAMTYEQVKRAIPGAIKLIEKDNQFTVAKKMKGTRIIAYRIAEKRDKHLVQNTVLISRKQIRGRVKRSNITAAIGVKKLGITDNQLSLFREIEIDTKNLIE